jgi:hypothetical protein
MHRLQVAQRIRLSATNEEPASELWLERKVGTRFGTRCAPKVSKYDALLRVKRSRFDVLVAHDGLGILHGSMFLQVRPQSTAEHLKRAEFSVGYQSRL